LVLRVIIKSELKENGALQICLKQPPGGYQSLYLKYWRALATIPEDQGYVVYGGEQSMQIVGGTLVAVVSVQSAVQAFQMGADGVH
jgi:hypothetical protein